MWLSSDNSNQTVVKEIEVDEPPEVVWEAISTERGREAWLDEDERDVHVESSEEFSRLVWWWLGEDGVSRVEIELVPAVSGTRVIVTESAPAAFPLTALATAFALA
jgi:uncharacterized protein YndB with AHSA1/START domain